MIFNDITNDIASAYLAFTGKPPASIDVKDYLLFRQTAIQEYKEGLHPAEPVASCNTQTAPAPNAQQAPVYARQEPVVTPDVSSPVPDAPSYEPSRVPESVQEPVPVSAGPSRHTPVNTTSVVETKEETDPMLALLMSVAG